MPIPKNPAIYRIVHWQNVAHILQYGLCCSGHPNADPNYIDIGHRQLISDRHEQAITTGPGGSLGEYVPFYFAGHSPMLYLIMNGHQGVTKRPQTDIVYLVSQYQRVRDENLPYVFTNMNARRRIAEFFTDPKDFDKLEWEIIRAQQWNNDAEHIGRMDYKQAEFLVHEHLPVHCLSALVVYNEERKIYFDALISQMQLEIPVYIDKQKQLYY